MPAIVPTPLTPTKLIYGALRDIGVTRPGYTLSPEQLLDGLDSLNDILDAWAVNRLFVPYVAPVQLPLIINQQAYPIGLTATAPFNIAAPPAIENPGILNPEPTNSPLRTQLKLLTQDEWAEKPVKNIGSTIPTEIYFDRGSPLGTLYLFPFPTAQVTLEIYIWQTLAAFANVTGVVTLAQGYALALRKTLAELLIPSYAIQSKINAPLYEDVRNQARMARENIESHNAPSPVMACDPAFVNHRVKGGWNYLTGQYEYNG